MMIRALKPDLNSYFRRRLHMGAYPTAPFPGNDHTITPDPKVDPYYFDYGPLLDAMRGKKWVLAPHCVEVADNAAKVNLFEVPGGYALPVTFGGGRQIVTVTLHHVSGLEKARCQALHPGEETATAITPPYRQDTVRLEEKLDRVLSRHKPGAKKVSKR